MITSSTVGEGLLLKTTYPLFSPPNYLLTSIFFFLNKQILYSSSNLLSINNDFFFLSHPRSSFCHVSPLHLSPPADWTLPPRGLWVSQRLFFLENFDYFSPTLGTNPLNWRLHTNPSSFHHNIYVFFYRCKNNDQVLFFIELSIVDQVKGWVGCEIFSVCIACLLQYN